MKKIQTKDNEIFSRFELKYIMKKFLKLYKMKLKFYKN